MSELVPADEIERIVGAERHLTHHYARAVSAEKMVYVLHSFSCKNSGRDLRNCLFSRALDNGIDEYDWSDMEDQPVRVTITKSQRIIPVRSGMRLGR